MAHLTVSKLARQVGVTPDTLRYYERAGLLMEPNRTASGYRLYSDEVADRLLFIKGAQRLGLRLREIRELLDVLDRGHCPCGHTEALLRHRIAEIEQETAQLRRLKRDLVRVLERFPSEVCEGDAAWPCQAEFIRSGKEVEHGRA